MFFRSTRRGCHERLENNSHHYTVYKNLSNPSLMRKRLKDATKDPDEPLHSEVRAKHQSKISWPHDGGISCQTYAMTKLLGAEVLTLPCTALLMKHHHKTLEWLAQENSQCGGRGPPAWGAL